MKTRISGQARSALRFVSGSLLGALLCISGASSAAPTSMFSKINTGACKKVPPKVAAVYDGLGLGAEECAAPGGWRMFLVSSDANSWLEIAHGKSLWTTEPNVVYENGFGQFPNLGGAVVEWRLAAKDSPAALIFRVSAQDPQRLDKGATLSRLFVVAIVNNQPRFCGVVKTNEEARRLAGNSAQCNKGLKLREQPLP